MKTKIIVSFLFALVVSFIVMILSIQVNTWETTLNRVIIVFIIFFLVMLLFQKISKFSLQIKKDTVNQTTKKKIPNPNEKNKDIYNDTEVESEKKDLVSLEDDEKFTKLTSEVVKTFINEDK